MNMAHFFRPLLCVFICLLVGGGSGFLTVDSISTWYVDINKPFFNPPNWIFGPVWTTLYTLMGVSAGLIWNTSAKNKATKKALLAFSLHLMLNGLWSILFFGLKNPELAFAEILLLLTSIIYYTALFYRICPITAWMQAPYIAWVGFASLLNGSIAWLN